MVRSDIMGSRLGKSIFFVAVFLLLCGWESLCRVSLTIAVEEGIGKYRPSAFMLIEAKSPHSIVASKRRFEIRKETRILNRNGRPIRIQNLPVPCKAQVDYETSEFGDPVALKIRIKDVFPGARTDWSDMMRD